MCHGNPDDIAGTSRLQPCCEPGEVLYAPPSPLTTHLSPSPFTPTLTRTRTPNPNPNPNPNPDQVLYAFYETYEDNLMEVGRSTPSIPAGQDTTLTEDPPN